MFARRLGPDLHDFSRRPLTWRERERERETENMHFGILTSTATCLSLSSRFLTPSAAFFTGN